MFTQMSCHAVSRYMARLLTKLPFFVLTYCLIISPSCARLTDKESDFDTTMPLHNAALLDKDPGDRAKAEDSYRDALRLFRHLHNNRDRETAALLRNLRRLRKQMRDYARAKQFFREALQIWRNAHGS
jgi:tetratricopeptide (TPR) repeat protein